MAETMTLSTQPREGRGTKTARRLRQQGLVPAVVYGHKETTVSIAVSLEALDKVIRTGTHVVDLQTNGTTQRTLIRDLQWDHLGKDILHVDFKRISADERVEVSVPIELRGTAPGVSGGGVLDQPMHTLQVECLATAVPDHIRVNIGELQLGQAIHVRELVLPGGLKVLLEPDAVVVQVKAPAAEVEATPATETVEPERIGRVKEVTEEETK